MTTETSSAQREMDKMTDSRAVEILAAHNEWRRGGDGPQTDPTMLGLALDHAIARLRDPAGVGGLDLELIAEMLEAYEQHTRCDLDLAHVESSILEQATLLREASERDAAGVHTARAQQPAAGAVDDETLAGIAERSFKAGVAAALAQQPAAPALQLDAGHGKALGELMAEIFGDARKELTAKEGKQIEALHAVQAALAQQPAAVDGAMVDRFIRKYQELEPWDDVPAVDDPETRRFVEALLTAALAAQPEGGA